MIDYVIWILSISVYIAGCGMFFSLSVKNFWFDTGSSSDDAVALLFCTAIWPIPMVFYFGIKITEWLADRYEW